MRNSKFITVDFHLSLGILGNLAHSISSLLEQARQSSADLHKEKQLLLQAADVHRHATELAHLLNSADQLPCVPTIENDRVVACCPQCGYEDREDAPDNHTKIHRHSGNAWCKQRVRDLLENPAYHEYVMRAVIAKEGRLFNEYWGRLKISWMSCTACGRREKTLAAADLDEYAPSGDELWWPCAEPRDPDAEPLAGARTPHSPLCQGTPPTLVAVLITRPQALFAGGFFLQLSLRGPTDLGPERRRTPIKTRRWVP